MSTNLSPQLLDGRYEVDTKTGCWNWTRYIRSDGYGGIQFNQTVLGAHRLSAAIYLGLNLEDSKILTCHKCDNRLCINPDHLFLGSHSTNAHDAIKKGRPLGRKAKGSITTSCKHGHSYPENLVIHNRHKFCLECKRIDSKRRYDNSK